MVTAAQLKVRFVLGVGVLMTLRICFGVGESAVQWRGIRITTWWQRAKGGVLILGPW